MHIFGIFTGQKGCKVYNMDTETTMTSRDAVFREGVSPFKNGLTEEVDKGRDFPLPIVPFTLDEETEGMGNDSKELAVSTAPVLTSVDENDKWDGDPSNDQAVQPTDNIVEKQQRFSTRTKRQPIW